MRKFAERANAPFQEILNGYANELIMKQLYDEAFQKIVMDLERKLNGKVRVELKINGKVQIRP